MAKTKTIIAIGGGKMYSYETLPIDRYIVSLTGKKRPKALFIPTASEDSEDYCESFNKVYGEKLGCKIDLLLLYKDKSLKKREIAKKIADTDLIYVSGGNTIKLIRQWKKFKIIPLLKKAYDNKIILAGMSAGAICWFENGLSDAKDGKLSIIKGLGFEKGFCTPHFNDNLRAKMFINIIRTSKRLQNGFGIEDNAALVINSGKYKAKSIKSAKVIRIEKVASKIIITDIKKGPY